jgi:hypothetical protein
VEYFIARSVSSNGIHVGQQHCEIQRQVHAASACGKCMQSTEHAAVSAYMSVVVLRTRPPGVPYMAQVQYVQSPAQ